MVTGDLQSTHASARPPGVADAVFRRTMAGQREVVFASTPLSEVEQRLLRLVNGFTPMPDLMSFGIGGDAEVRAALERLVLLTLVERVPAALNRRPRGKPGH